MGLSDLKEPEQPQNGMSKQLEEVQKFIVENQENPLVGNLIRAISNNSDPSQTTQPSSNPQSVQPKGIVIGGSPAPNQPAGPARPSAQSAQLDQDEEDRYRDQLHTMSELGMTNREENLAMLRYTKGDVQGAIDIIMKKQGK